MKGAATEACVPRRRHAWLREATMARKRKKYTKSITFPPLDPKLIGRRIRRVRKQRKWSLYDLERIAGIPRQTIASYECGARVPIRENLLRLSIALKRTVKLLALGMHDKRTG